MKSKFMLHRKQYLWLELAQDFMESHLNTVVEKENLLQLRGIDNIHIGDENLTLKQTTMFLLKARGQYT